MFCSGVWRIDGRGEVEPQTNVLAGHAYAAGEDVVQAAGLVWGEEDLHIISPVRE